MLPADRSGQHLNRLLQERCNLFWIRRTVHKEEEKDHINAWLKPKHACKPSLGNSRPREILTLHGLHIDSAFNNQHNKLEDKSAGDCDQFTYKNYKN
jgi:hypothetical protein